MRKRIENVRPMATSLAATCQINSYILYVSDRSFAYKYAEIDNHYEQIFAFVL